MLIIPPPPLFNIFQADDPKEAAKDILARAAARGIITGVNTDQKDANKSAKPSGSNASKSDKKKSDKKSGSAPNTPGRPTTVSFSTSSIRVKKARMAKTIERLSRPKTSPGVDDCNSQNGLSHGEHVESRTGERVPSSGRWGKYVGNVPPHRQIMYHVTPFR